MTNFCHKWKFNLPLRFSFTQWWYEEMDVEEIVSIRTIVCLIQMKPIVHHFNPTDSL